MNIPRTLKTPEVNLEVYSGKFSFIGRSITENPKAFYDPILDKIESYCISPLEYSELDLYFEYLSTASSIFVMKIMASINKLQERGLKVKVIIRYDNDDPDMYEKFQAMSQIVNVDAVYIAMEV